VHVRYLQGRSKHVRSQVKGVQHPPPSDSTIFGRPTAEVHRLLANVYPTAPRADFSGVRTMLQRRSERHSAALDVYSAQRDAAGEMLDWVAGHEGYRAGAGLTQSC
jgi:hypothetical protein